MLLLKEQVKVGERMDTAIYYNGTILTMEEPLYAEAVLVEDGVIRQVGSREALFAQKRADTRLVDLQGAVLLPAFIDPHSHITALAQTLGLVNLSGCKNFGEITERLDAFIARTKPDKGQWVSAFGYDHNDLEEKCHPDRALLDRYPFPVVVTHASGHMGVVNRMGLQALGITASTPNPEGGVIGRCAGTQEPNGYLEETAFTSFTARIPQPPLEQQMRQMEQAQDIYLQNGITTAQDGFTKEAEWTLLHCLAGQKRLKLDVVAYPNLPDNRKIALEHPQYCKQYHNRLKIGGYKVFLDGSPQGRTAWMSQPYADASDGYRGYAVHTDEEVRSYMRQALQDHMQILAHCNGDAAAQQMIDAYAAEKTGEDIRPVMIHAQLVRPDQLARMGELGMIASFFVAHTYYWGDVHLKNFGEARATAISPVRAAIDNGVVYTFHQDTPVILPNMLETLWCAVNRISKGGYVMGEAQRVSPLEALKGVTLYAAYQYFEENEKGSIRPGKRADFVLLDRDPLQVDPMELRDLRVLATIQGGTVVYERK